MESLPYAEAHENLVRDAVKRYAVLMLLAAALFGAAGAAYLASQPQRYTSDAKVLIRPTTGNALSPDSATSGPRVTVAMVTESAVVESPTIGAGVADTLGVSTEAAVRQVKATVPPNTQLVEIKYTAGTAEMAQRGAQAYADTYLAYRKGLSDAVVKTQLENLGKQQTEVAASLTSAGTAAAITDAKPDANAQVQLYAGRLATIQNNIATVQSTDTNPGTVVNPAVQPPRNSSIIDTVLVPALAVVGLLVGFLLALWLVRRDDRIRTGSEQSLFGVPVLATIPGRKGSGRSVITTADAVEGESYRRARAGLLAAGVPQGNGLAVLGASEGVLVGDVALNLASTLGRSGYTTTVIDATAGRESLAALSGDQEGPGLAEALTSGVDAVTPLAVSGATLVRAGVLDVDARDLFHSDQMRPTVIELAGGSDYTFIAGSGAATAEGSGVALAADGVLLVVEDRRTTHRSLAEAVTRCRELGSLVIGILVVPALGKGQRVPATALPQGESQSRAARRSGRSDASAVEPAGTSGSSS